jgi:hypothetical protein
MGYHKSLSFMVFLLYKVHLTWDQSWLSPDLNPYRTTTDSLCFIHHIIGHRWTYADSSWARIAALVPVVVSSAIDGDEVANKILHDSVCDLADSVIAVVRRLQLCGEGVVIILLISLKILIMIIAQRRFNFSR